MVFYKGNKDEKEGLQRYFLGTRGNEKESEMEREGKPRVSVGTAVPGQAQKLITQFHIDDKEQTLKSWS